MFDKLLSLAITMIGFAAVGYYMVTQLDIEVDVAVPALALAFVFWFIFWFAWAFRWVVVVAPVTITYILFAFYDYDERVVGTGIVISLVLFMLTGIQQYFGNRSKRKAEKAQRKQYDVLKRKFGE